MAAISKAQAVALFLAAVATLGLPSCVWCWGPTYYPHHHRRHHTWSSASTTTHVHGYRSARRAPTGALSSSESPALETSGEIGESNHIVDQDDDRIVDQDDDREKVEDEDEGDTDQEEEGESLWQDEQGNGAQLCRICTSADGEIPMSALPPHILNSNIRRRLDAIYHATSHQETSSLKYMKSEKQSSRQQLQSQGMMSSGVELPSQDVSAGLSDLEEQFDEEEERRLVSMIRSSLEDGGFELLDQRDLDLCNALNAGYLLRLSIQPDLKGCDPKIAEQFYPERFGTMRKDDDGDASTAIADASGGESSSTLADEFLFDGRILVFRRGYAEEVTIGRLLLPKLDYLQASIVQRSARIVTGRLARLERWVVRKCYEISGSVLAKTTDVLSKTPLPAIVKSNWRNATEAKLLVDETTGSNMNDETKILKLNRYGGSREQFVASPDLSEAINPFLVCETVTGSSNSSMSDALNTEELSCEYDANYHNRTAGPERPMRLLRRVSISNLVDFFSPQGRREIVRGYFEKAKLVEPTYEEVVVVWRPLPKKRPKVVKEVEPPKALIEVAEIFGVDDKLPEKLKKKRKKKKSDSLPSLKIRAFTDVPMANLPAVLPKTKLVFRPADAFVFDTISLFSLAAVLASQRFDNPKFDIIAIVSVSLWIIRTTFRYSNKLARYDLLVNKFLKERISHRGANALKYLSSEAATQKATRATLLYSTLQRWFQGQPDEDVIQRGDVVERGSKKVNEALCTDRLINIPVDSTLTNLESLGAVRFVDDNVEEVLNEDDLSEQLKIRWTDILP